MAWRLEFKHEIKQSAIVPIVRTSLNNGGICEGCMHGLASRI